MDYWVLLIANILALLANAAASVFWGVRYKRATDRLLEAKDAQMATLRELTSTKVFEHFQTTKTLLEESIRDKEEQIRALREDQQLSKHERRERLIQMKHQLEIVLQLSTESFKREVRMLEAPGRIDALEFPLDLKELESILRDAGLSDSNVEELMSKVATLPRDWTSQRLRGFLRESLLEVNAKRLSERIFGDKRSGAAGGSRIR
jgi:hypothetical protein